MDLNINKEQKLENSKEVFVLKSPVFLEIEINDNKSKINIAKNSAPKTFENSNFSNETEDLLYFYISSQKSYDDNVILMEKIVREPCFLRLLNVKKEEEKILLIYEKPSLSLLSFLLNNKEDIYSRFSLFKQSLEIIFKLISLDENFTFFNYSIFFVESTQIAKESKAIEGGNDEKQHNLLKLKILYHGKILFFYLF